MILLLFLLVLALPLFLGARRQKRALREAQELQSSLQVGERVLTTSGLHGTVVALSDETLELEVAPGVRTTWVRAAIRERVVGPGQGAEDAAAPTEDVAAPTEDVRPDRA